MAEDREHFYHYDCEGNLVFKEFKEMALRGSIVAPINKERLETELYIYGQQRKRPSAFIPFKYQGQYEDAETGLYYNRFRYYDLDIVN